MQSTAPHQALHSYPLIITHTHSLTSLKCLSKMSLRDSLHANYASSSFSVPFMLSISFFQLCVCLLFHPHSLSSYSLCLCLSFFPECFFLFSVLSLHFPQFLSSPLQVLFKHTFTDKSIICVQIKHTQYKTGLGVRTNTSSMSTRLNSLLLETSAFFFANLNKLYLLSFENVGSKGRANTETKMCLS